MNPPREIILCLGRFGDIVSVLPLAWARARRGVIPIFCVAKEFASILDGVSYVEPLVFDGRYDDPPAALRWLKANRPKDRITIAQAYRHPFDKRRETDSYEKEMWRLAGALGEFGKHPTVFDRRDEKRERPLLQYAPTDRPYVLVATDSVSSPFWRGAELRNAIAALLPEHAVVDLSHIKAERVYDLIALYECADCLVTVDSVHLHLARAAKVPVVALLSEGNLGFKDNWLGSVPPPNAVYSFRYSQAVADIDNLAKTVKRVVSAKTAHRFIVHVSDLHGTSARHTKARSTWESAYGEEAVIDGTKSDWTITAQKIGDARNLPKLRDVLWHAIEKTTCGDDVIIWNPDDVAFTDDSFRQMKQHAAIYGAFSMRRTEPGYNNVHIGREVFGFRAGWLAERMDLIPDFYCGAPCFDLIIAAIIRKERGIVTTNENLYVDFYPSEISPGIALHEPHQSSWSGPHENTMPANVHNMQLAREWCKNNCPSLSL